MLAKSLLGLGFLTVVYYVPTLAQPASFEGTGVTITHGNPGAPTPRCHNDPDRASNDCPGQITVKAPPMEPAPEGAVCAQPGYVLSSDRTYCVEGRTAQSRHGSD